MKSIFRFLLIGMMLVGVLSACTNKKAPTAALQSSFKTMFPNAKSAEWESEGSYYVVEFKENRLEKEAWFDSEGVWWMTHTEYERNPPAVIRNAVQDTQYSDWRIEDVDFVEQRDYSPFYEVELEKGDVDIDLYYSESGELLEERPAIVIPLPYL